MHNETRLEERFKAREVWGRTTKRRLNSLATSAAAKVQCVFPKPFRLAANEGKSRLRRLRLRA